MLCPQIGKSASHKVPPFIIIDPNKHMLGAGGITHGAEQVENRAPSEGLTGRANETHGGVMIGGKEKPDASLIYTLCGLFWRDGEINAERRECIGCPRQRTGRAVTMFGNSPARARADKGRRG